jgi:23S rRNA G2069 N7-methylase RlmK/C1962 C5-methylase RlmI
LISSIHLFILYYPTLPYSTLCTQLGDEVIVKDHNSNVFARGFFNPHSQYRVRVISHSADAEFRYPLDRLITTRIEQAVSLRRALALPSASTDVYRLVNGEGDRLSGLIIDVLGSSIVVQSSAMWVEKQADNIRSALEAAFGGDEVAKTIIWRRAEARWAIAKKTLTAPSSPPLTTISPLLIYSLFFFLSLSPHFSLYSLLFTK